MSVIRVVRKFGQILSAHQKKRILELAVLMVIGGLLETCSVSLMLPFMNAVMNAPETMNQKYVKLVCSFLNLQSSREFLLAAAIALAAVYILKNIYLLLEYHIQYQFVYGNMLAVQKKLLASYISRPYEYFLKINSGEIMRIIHNDTSSTFSLLVTVLNLFTELVVSGMLTAAIFVIAPAETLLIAAVLLVMVFVIDMTIKPVLMKSGIAAQDSYAGMNKWLMQSIQGIKEVKVMGTEQFFQEKYHVNGNIYIKSLRISQILNLMPRFFIEAASIGTMFLAIAAFIYHGREPESIIPMLSAVALAAIRLLPSVNRISGALAAIAYTEPMLDKLAENLEDITAQAGEINSAVCSGFDKFEKSIEFSHVTYQYPKSESPVLNCADMIIRRGTSVGIAGPSGAGKTTAADIMLGLLKPQSGTVLADGKDIFEDIRGWHAQTGYIPQSIFMLDDTVRANVAFGIPEQEISDEQVWKALEEASLADFVRALPNKLDTQMGERGVRLSGGQRQRIGIARALYRSPDILIFDEATSALDNETESAIMESVNRLHGKKTMIIIAHRLTTIEGCDEIYRVEGGKIVRER